MKKYIFTGLIVALLLLSNYSFAQNDWTTNSSNLYYWNGTENIDIQSNATSAAVYFNSIPSNRELRELRRDFPEFELNAAKKLLVLNSNRQISGLTSVSGRRAFLERYDLLDADAFEVLPMFIVEGGYPAWFTDKVLVRLRPNVNISSIASYLEDYGASVDRVINGNTYSLNLSIFANQLPLIQELKNRNLIVWGQPDFRVSIEKTNDPLYPEQYQMNNTGATIDGQATTADIDIDAPEAWAITTGNSSLRVAVMDDGLESHPDLPPIIGGLSPVNNGNGGVVAGSNHGVACAGIVAAQHNNIGVRGVAPDVQLQSINIFVGGESNQDIADGFYWARDNGSDVISNSWGFTTFFGLRAECGDNPYPVITDAINDVAQTGRNGKGCVIIFASGNNGQNCVTYPGSLPSVIGVGALTATGVVTSYSNFGPRLDVVSPSDGNGFGVRTTDRVGGAGYASGDYTLEFGGTSAACPTVAGIGALILAVDPNLTGEQVHDIIRNTADDMGPAGFDNQHGHGRANAHQAVLEAQGNGGGGGCTPGAACDDGDDCTINDVFDSNCNCAGTFTDADNDGFCVGDDPNDNDSCIPDDSDPSCNTGGGGGDCSTLDNNDFEGGLGIWNLGGNDARRNSSDSNFANSGSFCVRLRDNSGASSSMFTDDINAAAYDQLEVSFSYIVTSFESNEDFFLEISTNGGSSYSVVESWVVGTDFQNDVRENETVTVSANLTASTRLRIRCDASNNGDRLFIDDVVIKGCGDNGGGGGCTPGAACDDGDDCTINDVFDNNCNCAGTFTDADNDGFCVGDDPNDNDACVPDDSDPSCNTGGGGGDCDAPVGLEATAISKRRATLNWNAVSDANDYDVQYREAGTSTWTDRSTADTQIRITGLRNRTTYEWRVRANCSDGTSDWSVTCEFTAGTSSSGGCGAGLIDGQRGDLTFTTLSAYPNPASNALNVQLNLSANGNLRLIDVMGRTVFEVSVGYGMSTQEINVNDLPKGIYFLELRSEGETQIEKVIVE
ncbi:MAG: S8 family serine peptidase [Bacteroidota bacterium]